MFTAPEVVAVFRLHVESLVRTGGNRGREEAAKYLSHQANIQTAAVRGAYDDLRICRKAARNFSKAPG